MPPGFHLLIAAQFVLALADSAMLIVATATLQQQGAHCNDGDWVESLTALVDHADRRLELLDWAAHQRRTVAAAASDASEAAASPALAL